MLLMQKHDDLKQNLLCKWQEWGPWHCSDTWQLWSRSWVLRVTMQQCINNQAIGLVTSTTKIDKTKSPDSNPDWTCYPNHLEDDRRVGGKKQVLTVEYDIRSQQNVAAAFWNSFELRIAKELGIAFRQHSWKNSWDPMLSNCPTCDERCCGHGPWRIGNDTQSINHESATETIPTSGSKYSRRWL